VRLSRILQCRASRNGFTAIRLSFPSPPKEQLYGIEAIMKDDSGNWFSMTESKGA
jgi:hypothetical protein